MKDVTSIFKKALFSHSDWMINTFHAALFILEKNDINISFWEREENWASVIQGDRIAAYIWQKYPLILFEKNSYLNLPLLLKEYEVINYIEADNLNSSLFKINCKKTGDLLDAYPLNLNSFTLEDLWFRTNAI
ncbi:hypothetical protein [Dysgonomonas macrotermitis]|uniref:Uncharacterized protein n=1 Tax=Dysgonomonas macrotermitis TaxID=1346286 RepID=A0A1M4Y4T1_9BACT|nr:hypothetical protein [Dysgonomonas macrotermitis]SHF00705.1 hypothetical protein SAMN05444362_10372 [Dysgonomonas macrotermitis]